MQREDFQSLVRVGTQICSGTESQAQGGWHSWPSLAGSSTARRVAASSGVDVEAAHAGARAG